MKRNKLLPSLAAIFAALVAPVEAQTAPANAGNPAGAASNSANGSAAESTIELSPFVVTESSDVGWVATETLAGSRLRTNFKDVPNQIETLTKEFMQDLGLRTFEEALIYTANVENDSDYIRPTAGDSIIFPGSGGRVRGVGSGTLSRNFFQTQSPTDNYNIERATVASGPNAILFGLGSPAGILDATPARALMRNRYGFTLLYDSEESKRGTFDANVVVVPQKLAVRLMGLSKREYTEKRPNLDRNDRIYGTLTFKPFANTTLVLQGERNSRAWNSAGRIAPLDFVTPWLNADQVTGGRYGAQPVYDNSSFAGIATDPIFSQFSEAPIFIRGDNGQMQSWRNSVIVKGPGTLPGLDPTFDAGAAYTILDPSIFPLDVNVMGSARTSVLDSYNKTVILEQKLASTLFLELAYNHEDATRHQLSGGGWNGGVNFQVRADPNRYIPGTTTPNPHLGEYYYQGTAGGRLLFYEHDDWRATLSYELDLARQLGSRGAWGKWLGRHRLAGLYSGSREENRNQTGFDRRILDDHPVIPGVTLRPRTFQNWATHATRNPQFRYYLNEGPATGLGPFQFGEWTLNDATGQPYSLYAVDTPLVAADGKRLGGGAAAAGV